MSGQKSWWYQARLKLWYRHTCASFRHLNITSNIFIQYHVWSVLHNQGKVASTKVRRNASRCKNKTTATLVKIFPRWAQNLTTNPHGSWSSLQHYLLYVHIKQLKLWFVNLHCLPHFACLKRSWVFHLTRPAMLAVIKEPKCRELDQLWTAAMSPSHSAQMSACMVFICRLRVTNIISIVYLSWSVFLYNYCVNFQYIATRRKPTPSLLR